MKILFVSNIPSPYRVEFFNELGKHCNLTVAFEGQMASDRDKAWFTESPSGFKPVYMKGKQINHEQYFCTEVVSVIKQGFDIIILGGYSSPTSMLAIAYMKLRKIPFYIEVDGGLIREDSRPKYLLKKTLISSASGWISSGKHTTQYLLHYGAKPDAVYHYPFSSLRDSDILPKTVTAKEKSDLRQELNITSQKVVLAIGQFIPRKGFDVLMRAATSLDAGVGIYIVGGDPTEEYLKLNEELKLHNVHFVGFKNKVELAKYYKASDLFVLPTREDIWGLVINEAMAYGLPVITTDNCVAGLELVEDGVNGYIVSVDDFRTLTEKINRVFSSDLEKMGKASLEKIRPYTIENMVKAHLKIFNHRR